MFQCMNCHAPYKSKDVVGWRAHRSPIDNHRQITLELQCYFCGTSQFEYALDEMADKILNWVKGIKHPVEVF
jgi:hypothetical protein